MILDVVLRCLGGERVCVTFVLFLTLQFKNSNPDLQHILHTLAGAKVHTKVTAYIYFILMKQ